MELSIEVFTPMLDLQPFFAEVDYVIQLLSKHKIGDVQLYLGTFDDNKQLLNIKAEEIKNEIKKFEQIIGGNPWENGVFINIYITMLHLETEVLFCHEADLHLSFNYPNALVLDILNSWKAKELIHAIKKGRQEMTWEELELSL